MSSARTPARARTSTVRPVGRSAAVQLCLLRFGLGLLRHTARRGYQSSIRALGRAFPRVNRAQFVLEGGVPLSVRLNDPYWIRNLLVEQEYEPEMGVVLNAILNNRSAFVDCGANIGVWSAIAAVLIGDHERVLAVEPGGHVIDELRRNAELSPVGFGVLEAALWTESGTTLTFIERRAHADSSLGDVEAPSGDPETSRRQVRTVSLDDVLASAARDADLVVVKLDVEGAEIRCLEASNRLRTDAVVLVYEDHGSDPSSEVSRWLIDQGFATYALTPDGRELEPITLEQISRRKVSAYAGYNFVSVLLGRENLLAPVLRPS